MRGGDLIGTLPDELLQHVLSLLPSRDAVQSSLLSRRWRDLWKSAPAVRVSGRGDAFRRFVDSLLLHRNDASQLRSFEIDGLVIGPPEVVGDVDNGEDEDDDLVIGPPELIDDVDDDDHEDGEMVIDPPELVDDVHVDEDDYEDDDEIIGFPETIDERVVDRWIMHALSTCRATSLTARFDGEMGLLWRPVHPDAFASHHLTTMHLELVYLADGLLDFSSCPALLNLTLSGCRLYGDALVSPSLERLRIIHCDIATGRYTAGRKTTMRISTPSLRHLQFSDGFDGGEQTILSLDRMPRLTTASIRLTGTTKMYPGNNRHGCSLLPGLSEATTLELIASTPDGMEILQRDLTWCPTFTKLKTLTLNKWCAYDDALARLLRHTPTLDQLILRLGFESGDEQEEKTELESYIASQHLFPTLENLKTLEIQRHCPYSDTTDDQISKMFSDSWGIPRAKVRCKVN